MTFNQTAEVMIVGVVGFVVIFGAGGLVIMAIEKLTGWKVPPGGHA